MPQWVTVARIADIKPGEGKTVDLCGKPVALFNCKGTCFAIDNTCPHRGGSLGEGRLKDRCVICPLHQWTFDLQTGENIRNPKVKLKVYPVRIDGENILIAL